MISCGTIIRLSFRGRLLPVLLQRTGLYLSPMSVVLMLLVLVLILLPILLLVLILSVMFLSTRHLVKLMTVVLLVGPIQAEVERIAVVVGLGRHRIDVYGFQNRTLELAACRCLACR